MQAHLRQQVEAQYLRRVQATVRRSVRPAELLTCRAGAPAGAATYEVSDLREVADEVPPAHGGG
jgi:hypothetical protein